MAALQIEQVPVLSDNYVYLIYDPDTKACACVDPAVSAPIKSRLDELGWRLTHIFNTHHHHDHIGGNLQLKQAYECEIVGAAIDANRIDGIDTEVREGEMFQFGSKHCRIFEVPGHTSGHIAYWFEEDEALFCGDTLFALGCGRLFEGTAAQMWHSLSKFRSLPDDTRVYCAHEYTEANAEFAITVDPENAALISRQEKIKEMRAEGLPTVPSTIGLEKHTNPFLRAEETSVQKAVSLIGKDAVDVFAEVRRRKDNF
ncbi:hydroxyacylglutathione hydrolase [Terasakiella sp. A23]|uniref:hydroxyacylglutathione hydrolase n=1 Tax=Terasakiella sp. FCG-A23 TaxID=3080561 RepID=UPI0029546AE2|nr:hydroxyacylglutathione hydrolase [Terasakiella sp. A23]MDV7339512.1 hydroxyacylglutathione hydrolase [Terasakiella sp. A23]